MAVKWSGWWGPVGREGGTSLAVPSEKVYVSRFWLCAELSSVLTLMCESEKACVGPGDGFYSDLSLKKVKLNWSRSCVWSEFCWAQGAARPAPWR